MSNLTGLQDANGALGRLAARQSRLESRLLALDRVKLQARRDLERAQRDHAACEAKAPRVQAISVVRRLELAQQALGSAQRERDEIAAELPGIRTARHEVIQRAASPAWAGLQRYRAQEYAAGVALAASVEALVAPYAQVVEQAALAKTELDTLLATLGQDSNDIRKGLSLEVPETRIPDTPEDRRALRRAQEIRNVFCQELSYKW